jgi:hypothetical protein
LSFQVLPGSSKAVDKKIESIQDRIAKQRAITTAFLSEHCLPFSIAGDLLDLAKCLAEDRPALYVNMGVRKEKLQTQVPQQVEDNGKELNLRYEIENSKKNEHNPFMWIVYVLLSEFV